MWCYLDYVSVNYDCIFCGRMDRFCGCFWMFVVIVFCCEILVYLCLCGCEFVIVLYDCMKKVGFFIFGFYFYFYGYCFFGFWSISVIIVKGNFVFFGWNLLIRVFFEYIKFLVCVINVMVEVIMYCCYC